MKNLFDLENKIAVITGGGGVLGGSMGTYLSNLGVKVAVMDLRKEQAAVCAEEIKAKGGDAIAIEANVLQEESLIQAKEEVLSHWGKIDILINAAGGNMPGATISPEHTIFDLSIDSFKKVSELNLTGSVLPSLIFGKEMADKGSGVIINISSMTAQRVITRVVGYSVAKSAIDNFTKWMAVEMARKFGEGIRVNAIAPGFFIGDQNRKLLLEEDGSLTERGKTIIDHTPMGRFGKAEELNGTIHWLCSPAASFVTGVVVPIDGGFSVFSGV
ncbi:MAG: SDR family oxidoreductase [Bacteroidota bacterium]